MFEHQEGAHEIDIDGQPRPFRRITLDALFIVSDSGINDQRVQWAALPKSVEQVADCRFVGCIAGFEASADLLRDGSTGLPSAGDNNVGSLVRESVGDSQTDARGFRR